MTVTRQLLKQLQKKLTYTIPNSHNPQQPIIIKNCITVNPNLQGKILVSIPIGRTDLIPASYQIVDKRFTKQQQFPQFIGKLRDSQQQVADFVQDNAIIGAKPGWGKTFWAIYHASQVLKQKTLIVVHTVALRTQWQKQIVKTLGFKPGVIGSGKFNIQPPIVVANVQSFTKYAKQLSRTFGALYLDQMHHVSSPTFSKVVDCSFARYKIGLSGTLIRKDGKHVVFRDYFSNNVIKPVEQNVMKPQVHVYNTGMIIPSGGNWAQKVTQLQAMPVYRQILVRLAKKYSDMGHKVLIVSDRVQTLRHGAQQSGDRAQCVVGGQQRQPVHQRLMKQQIDQLWGTQSIYCQGISLDLLSTLILGGLINNQPLLQQLVGRVKRKWPNKLKPIIVDLRMNGHTGVRQFNTRMGFYMRQGLEIKYQN